MDFEWKNDTGWQKWPKMKFPYNDTVSVELKEMLDIRPTFAGVDVRQWGVCILHATIDTFESRLTEFFRELCSHIEESFRTGEPPTEQNRIWMRVVKTIRYEQFSWDISPAMYEIFTIVRADGQSVVLRREDGREDTVSYHQLPYVLHPGDHMGAYVKRGRQQEIVTIEYDHLVTPVSKKEADRLWNSLKRM